MAEKTVRCLRWIGPILLASFFLMGMQLSGRAAQDQAPGAAPKKSATHQSLSVTGCLQKGSEAGGHYIVGDDGKMWELSSKSVKLDEHVGHKVTVTGYQLHKSAAAEKKMETGEKAEAAGKDYADLAVSKLQMVSETCSQ